MLKTNNEARRTRILRKFSAKFGKTVHLAHFATVTARTGSHRTPMMLYCAIVTLTRIFANLERNSYYNILGQVESQRKMRMGRGSITQNQASRR